MGEGEAKAMILSQYTINGFWGPRPETPEALAVKFDQIIDRLAVIDPVFGNWIWSGRQPNPIAFATIRPDLAKRIAAAVTRDDYGGPDPDFGYLFGTLNSLKTTPRSMSVNVRAGCRVKASFYSNTASIETGWHVEPDPAIVTYPIFKAALLALCECFEITFCHSYPDDLTDLWPSGQKFRLGWMSYVSPRFAPLITPPKTGIVEYRPNGALFMAATDETFVTANPQHLAAARDIEAAIAPLNALPWPPDAEPE
jgi:Immunity protein 52